MTDKELLEFCKQHNVKVSVEYNPDRGTYRLQMKRGQLQFDYLFSQEHIDTSKAWGAIVQSELTDMEENLTHMEKSREKEKHNDPD